MTDRTVLIGIDVGGTFTDVFTLDQGTGTVGVHKVASTRRSEADGFFRGVCSAEADFGRIAAIVHGTTVGTNALLERKGAQTGLITTDGFRDILQMRRRDRPETWGLRGSYQPVVERAMSAEVKERVLSDGRVLAELDEDDLEAAAMALLAKGATSVAAVFVNAYANNANEQKARRVLERIWPNRHISISSELLPEIREFERASTTALNAYLQPVVGDYLRNLDERLEAQGFEGEFLIVQSNGGLMGSQTAAEAPVCTALSGPAAGVCASAYIAAQSGFENVITCDLGGTSFDVSVIAEGEAAISQQTSVDFGLVIRSPMIEITTIGAGGGSIAWIDGGGMLQIGPESAGSAPGPVCYGQGNDRPTVTDANLILGRINPDSPIGGALSSLDVGAARQAVKTHIAGPLGMDVSAAAEAIIEVTNARMAGAIRLVSIERGHDPRRFALMPFGGGGALHCCALVREIGLKSALIPRYPGIVSALGCVIADMRLDFVKTLNVPLRDADIGRLAEHIGDFDTRGRDRLSEARTEFSGVERKVSLDMLYAGQSHTIEAVLPPEAVDGLSVEAIRAAFEARYRSAYGTLLTGVEPIIANVRVAVVGMRPKFDLSLLSPRGDLSSAGATCGSRTVYAHGQEHKAAVHKRIELPVGAVVSGPAILDQEDTTIWIEPGFSARIDKIGNLILEQGAA